MVPLISTAFLIGITGLAVVGCLRARRPAPQVATRIAKAAREIPTHRLPAQMACSSTASVQDAGGAARGMASDITHLGSGSGTAETLRLSDRVATSAGVSSLEQAYASHIQNLTGPRHGRDYREPNERNPRRAVEHLAMRVAGLVVSVGSERSFFNLILSFLRNQRADLDSNPCQGLVVRDLEPLIKLYVDFNILLIRISENMEDYQALSSYRIRPQVRPEDDARYAELLRDVSVRLEQAEMPQFMREYYQRNFERLARAYYETPRRWRAAEQGDFPDVQYDKDERLFQIVQRYARQGNIIATIGDIADLRFLAGRTTSIVDISNIQQYCQIFDLQGAPESTVLWTECRGRDFDYHSYRHLDLEPEQKRELERLMEEIRGVPSMDPEASGFDLPPLVVHPATLRFFRSLPPSGRRDAQ